MKTALALMAALALSSTNVVPPAAQTSTVATGCPRCGWRPPVASRTVGATNLDELERAMNAARPGDEILLADGRYGLRRTLDIGTPNVTVRSRSGDPSRVVLHGQGMTGDSVGVGISVGAMDVTIADLTVRSVGFHAIQVRGEAGASRFTMHNTILEDTGQQLLKGSIGDNGQHAADGVVACSVFNYTTSAPSDYTNGVDILGTKRWVIRDNRLSRIRGPKHASGPAILAWRSAEDTIVERNVIVDSFRGVALGLTERDGARPYDHLRGVVRNNVIVNLNTWADEAIEANGAQGARIYHNTVLVQGQVGWSISARFPTASVDVRNNLTNKPVLSRDGGLLVANDGNVTNAAVTWFVNAPGLDLHLSPDGAKAVDAGVALADITEDFDRLPRGNGRGPTAGAHEAPIRAHGLR